MTTHTGYPDEMLDDTEYFKNLHINPDKYFQSFLGMNVFGTSKAQISCVSQSTKPIGFDMPSQPW